MLSTILAASKRFETLLYALVIVGAGILMLMVVGVSLDVVLRNTINRTIPAILECTEFALYGTTLLAGPYLLNKGQHIRMELVLTMLPPQKAWWLELFADVCGFLVSVVFAIYAIQVTVRSFAGNWMTTKTLVFPEWWLLAPLPIGIALVAVEFLFRIARLFGSGRSARSEATSLA
jgi:TRAP-type C4-dicarboxylate transport system permease small subunit